MGEQQKERWCPLRPHKNGTLEKDSPRVAEAMDNRQNGHTLLGPRIDLVPPWGRAADVLVEPVGDAGVLDLSIREISCPVTCVTCELPFCFGGEPQHISERALGRPLRRIGQCGLFWRWDEPG